MDEGVFIHTSPPLPLTSPNQKTENYNYAYISISNSTCIFCEFLKTFLK